MGEGLSVVPRNHNTSHRWAGEPGVGGGVMGGSALVPTSSSLGASGLSFLLQEACALRPSGWNHREGGLLRVGGCCPTCTSFLVLGSCWMRGKQWV